MLHFDGLGVRAFANRGAGKDWPAQRTRRVKAWQAVRLGRRCKDYEPGCDQSYVSNTGAEIQDALT